MTRTFIAVGVTGRTLKLVCPCSAVLVFNPTGSVTPPDECAFCKRRVQWPACPIEDCPAALPPHAEQQDARPPEGGPTPSVSAGTTEACARGDLTGMDDPDGGIAGCIAPEVEAVTSPAPQPLHEGPDLTVEAPRAVVLVRAPSLPPLTTEHAWRNKPFIVHPARARDHVVTLADELVASGHGTAWPCAHGTDQIGGRRCVRCCIAKDLSYVWRKPAGGSPGAFRWLCGPCEAVYAALGLLGTERLHVTNMANRARPVWVEARA